jgi:hypothetical protein
VSEIEDQRPVLRRRPLPGRLRYAARQLDGVCAQDSAGQARLIAVARLLNQDADEAEEQAARLAKARAYLEATAGSCRVQARLAALDVLRILDGKENDGD